MSLDVAVVGFPRQLDAGTVFGRLPDAPWKNEAAFVERRNDGRVVVRGTFAGRYVDFDETDRFSESRARDGALTGGLVGALFGPPALAAGLVLGWIVGAQTGRPTESEPQPRKLVDELRAAVPPGGSAIVLLAAADHVDAMLDALAGANGEVRRHTLDDEQIAELETALSGAPAAAQDPPPS